MVDTEAPTTIVGPYPNYYNQRVRSWDMAEHAYAYEFFRVLFFTRHKTFGGTLVLKWFQFYSCYSVIADWIRIPVMFMTIWVSWHFFVTISAIFVVLYTLLTIVWDFLGYRRCPERRSRLVALLTFQLYKIPSIFIRLLGMCRAFLVYLPNFKAKPTIPEIEAEYLIIANQQTAKVAATASDEETRSATTMAKIPVWLDKTNPYYAHYDPKKPTYTGHYETEPDVPEELPSAMTRDPDSDSVTTLTMDEALLRDQDTLSFRAGQRSHEKHRTSLTPTIENANEEEGYDEEKVEEDTKDIQVNEEMPAIAENEEYITEPNPRASLFGKSTSDSVSTGASSSLRDSFVRPKPLSVVPEESVEVSTEPSGFERSRAGQETCDSSGAFTSALGPKTMADGSSISTLTFQPQNPRTIPLTEGLRFRPQRNVVDTVPGGPGKV